MMTNSKKTLGYISWFIAVAFIWLLGLFVVPKQLEIKHNGMEVPAVVVDTKRSVYHSRYSRTTRYDIMKYTIGDVEYTSQMEVFSNSSIGSNKTITVNKSNYREIFQPYKCMEYSIMMIASIVFTIIIFVAEDRKKKLQTNHNKYNDI